MKILYIAEDLFNSTVHTDLCNSLGQMNDVYVTGYEVDRYRDTRQRLLKAPNTETISYKLPINCRLRYKWDFNFKIKIKFKYIVENSDVKKFDLVHASTLFSDGAVAYKLYKKYGIPYIAAIRGTDVNLYFKYFIHLWPLAYKIISNAKKIIYISSSMKYNLNNNLSFSMFRNILNEKTCIIPNGISNIWINDLNNASEINHNAHSIIYIGRFNKNKNVERLIKAVQTLKQKFPDLKLTLVGGGGNRHSNIVKLVDKNPDILNYVGFINDKNKLKLLLRANSIFAMVSHSETFGLVFIEALSQGLKVLMTQNQGIDHLFKEKIGETVNSYSLKSIKNGLNKLLCNNDIYTIPYKEIISMSWNNIANQYYNQYKMTIDNITK